MRVEAEIMAMHDRLIRDSMIFTGNHNHPAIVALGWVCDRLVPDAEILAAADLADDDDEYEIRAEDVAERLVEMIVEDELPALKEYLSRPGTQLEELAATARKIDRLCKAEMKRRKDSV